jgi:hypothetical protein
MNPGGFFVGIADGRGARQHRCGMELTEREHVRDLFQIAFVELVGGDGVVATGVPPGRVRHYQREPTVPRGQVARLGRHPFLGS